jgi:hypothetical protein
MLQNQEASQRDTLISIESTYQHSLSAISEAVTSYNRLKSQVAELERAAKDDVASWQCDICAKSAEQISTMDMVMLFRAAGLAVEHERALIEQDVDMLSKKDLGSSFAQGRERVVSWNQVQKQFVQAVSTAAVQEICFEAGGMSSTVFKPLLTAFFASQPTKYRGLPRFFHYFGLEAVARRLCSKSDFKYSERKPRWMLSFSCKPSKRHFKIFDGSNTDVGVLHSDRDPLCGWAPCDMCPSHGHMSLLSQVGGSLCFLATCHSGHRVPLRQLALTPALGSLALLATPGSS